MESEQRTPFLTEAISSAPVQVSKYAYNLAGALVEETYPSGRVVKNSFNVNGDLSAITSKAANTAYATYASNFSYTATGLISKLQLGNGRWETAKFNDRQQITELALGTTQTDTSLWKLNYDYDEQFGGNAPANTGNISKQTITFAGQANPFVQTYKYDSLNRITEAKETSGNTSTVNWQQNYSYDRYGNRIDFAQSIGGQSLALNSLTLPEVDSTTNRFTDTQTYHYDKTGNITTDQTPAGTRNFTFNGDNKQIEIRDPAVAVTTANPDANVIGKYYYDGEGKRVKKVTATEVTIFVYSAGKLAEEYSTEAPPPTPTINYVHTDTLQSVRAVSDKLGNIISRRDFMPYGEELTAGAAGRLATDKYTNGADAVRQRFTGYEKDQETGLDFAEARYYNNQHGRFTAVDPLSASGRSANPQTFNRYVYVGNNPANVTDPSGLTWYYNKKTNRNDWYDEESKTFKWGGGGLTDDWSAVTDGIGAGHFVYGQGDYWTTLDPNSSDYTPWGSQDAAKWDYGSLTNYNGNGNIPLYGTFVLPMISGIKTGNVGRATYGFAGTAISIASLPRTGAGLLKEAASEGFTYATGLPFFNPKSLFSKRSAQGLEEASSELINLISKKRTVLIVEEGSHELEYLNRMGAAANAGGENMQHILLRKGASKVDVLEEFLHGTQYKAGLLGSSEYIVRQNAEIHVNNFMLRHKTMLQLTSTEVENIEMTLEKVKKGIF